MLEFFRKYQTYFFAVITFVIIISFSFFGTYSTIQRNPMHEQIAFTAIDGTQVTRGELDELVLFLGSDNDDKWLHGGMWGPNFLNDGVIKKDFLATGLAEILAAAYQPDIELDLVNRTAREKRYALYVHPQAQFLSVESVWTYFVPNMKANFNLLKQTTQPASPEAFKARVALYLDEQKLPAPMLRQVLRYQERQYPWLTADANLDRFDLSLFGYHSLDDWFGPRFIRIVSEFIINSSKIAEEKGYKVTKEEALADLIYNGEISYQQNLKNPYLGVKNSAEYINEQLNRLGMDRNKAAKVWRQVLLFRRFFHDVGNAVITDPLVYQSFYSYAKEQVEGDIYQLPKDLQLPDFRSLQKLEIYLDAVSKRDDKHPLALPTTFLTIEEAKKRTPELVQKQYLLEVAKVQKKNLQSKVALKEMWNWEVSDETWPTLKDQFPELAAKNPQTREERMAVLDSLDDSTRNRIDIYARNAIVETHPEWLQQALDAAESKRMAVGLRSTGGSSFVTGLTDREQLMKLLDQAPIEGQTSELQLGLEAAQALSQFTADNNNFYRIAVIERSPSEEILTFAEANKEGILDQLLDSKLEDYYKKNRDRNAGEFKNDDGSWKPFADVKDRVAQLYFAPLIKAVRTDYAKAMNQEPKVMPVDQAASLRFYAYVRGIQEGIKQENPEALAAIQTTAAEPSLADAFSNQWKLRKESFKVDRSKKPENFDIAEVFALSEGEWTPVRTPVNGNLFFIQMQRKEPIADASLIEQKLQEGHQLISDDAQRTLMHRVVAELKDKQAITVDYLNRSDEMDPEIEPELES